MSTRMLTNAFNNRFKGRLFESATQPYDSNPVDDHPVTVADAKWEEYSDSGKNYLKRSYSIPNLKVLKYFISEVLDIATETHHHPELLIKEKGVDVILYTKDINDITYLDYQLSEKINDLMKDIINLLKRD